MAAGIRVGLGLALALGVMAASPRAQEISPAERLVFVDAHLRDVHPPTVLHYAFEETGTKDGKHSETLDLKLGARPDGSCCTVAAEEPAGGSFGMLAPVEDAKANPVILYFLERDVQQMQALTGGQSNYFRRRIRMSLVDHARVTDTKVSYQGRELAAHEVRVAPYADDPHRGQFAGLADKVYIFVLAPEAPGGVYQIRTITSGSAPFGQDAPQALLTLAGVAGDPSPARR